MVKHFWKKLGPSTKVATWALLIFLIFTRFWNLGEKPFHHDESLYANTSWVYATSGNYQFNPMLHGPFLFTFHAGLFHIFPDTDFTGRLPSAIFGTLFVLMGFLFFLRWSSIHAITFLALSCFSPVISYFSRFLGMDMPLLGLFMTILFCILQFIDSKNFFWVYIATFLFACMACVKLNFIFYFVPIATFPFLKILQNPKIYKSELCNIWKTTNGFISNHISELINVLLIFLITYILLFSSLGTHPEGVLDGLYRKMLPYWIKQNEIQRIKGPFHYYFPILATYELPVLIATFVLILHSIWKNLTKKSFYVFICLLAAISLISIPIDWKWHVLSNFFDKKLHMDASWHFSLLLLFFLLWFFAIRSYHKKPMQMFSIHWFFISLILYSYAGEKIPWLTTHVIFPMIFYLCFELPSFFEKWMEKIQWKYSLGVCLIVLTSWQGVILLQSSFANSANPNERLVYTHTSEDIKQLVETVNLLSKKSGMGDKFPIAVHTGSQPVWPLAWYFRHYKNWLRYPTKEKSDAMIIIDDWWKRQEAPMFGNYKYSMEEKKLRVWWVPDQTKVSLAGLIKYFFTREPYSPVGGSSIVVFTHKSMGSLLEKN